MGDNMFGDVIELFITGIKRTISILIILFIISICGNILMCNDKLNKNCDQKCNMSK